MTKNEALDRVIKILKDTKKKLKDLLAKFKKNKLK